MEIEEGATYEYLPFRGITKETMAFYDAKTKCINGKPSNIIYRYNDNAIKIRYLNSKSEHPFSSQGDISTAGVWGKDKFSAGSAKAITITEGHEDAMSIFQIMGSKYPVVSVQSSTVAKRDCIQDRDYLNSFERVYICFDNDEAGRKATAEVASLFDFNKVYHVKLTKYKDANDYLQRGEGSDLSKIWWNSKRFLPEGVISSISEMEELVTKEPKRGVPFPFETLDRMTYGIQKGKIVLLTALEGVGKTEIMRSIEYNLLKGTDENVGSIFLEEPAERHLQGLAGIELKSPLHLPGCSVSESEKRAAIRRVVGKDDRLHLYSSLGSDDPDVLLDTIRFLATSCQCGYILLDHITMVVSGRGAGSDERKELDYVSTHLEMMAQELNFALIIVSHVNDEGKTRGSRNIGKTASVRIDARRDIEEGSNLIKLTISKNRQGAHTGPAGELEFDYSTYCLKEKRVEVELPL